MNKLYRQNIICYWSGHVSLTKLQACTGQLHLQVMPKKDSTTQVSKLRDSPQFVVKLTRYGWTSFSYDSSI